MPPIDLSIIIVHWNTPDHLMVCLESLQRGLRGIRWEVIVVDNASEERFQHVIDDVCPQARVMSNSENVGFAKAANQGFEITNGRYVLVLNPDAFICDGAIKRMMQVLQTHPDIGIVGPKVLDQNGVPVPACRRRHLSLWRILWELIGADQLHARLLRWVGRRNSFGSSLLKTFDRSELVESVQGSCLMARKIDINRLGLFDSRVPLYLDDGDLCKRFSEAGLKVFYCAEAHVVHAGGVSVSRLPNPRLTSLMRYLAYDAYFLKHHSRFHVFVHHKILFFVSIVYLAVDALLFPIGFFFNRRFVGNYAVLHALSLRYALFFRFETRALPRSWPRSIRPLFHNREAPFSSFGS